MSTYHLAYAGNVPGGVNVSSGASYPRHGVDNDRKQRSNRNANASQVDDVSVVNSESIESTNVLSRFIDTFFTFSIVFSLALMPIVILQAAAPDVILALMTTAAGLIVIPYIILMVAVGLKVSSLFGCSAWYRITNPQPKQRKR